MGGQTNVGKFEFPEGKDMEPRLICGKVATTTLLLV